jgi:hypothetical protein
MTAIPLQFGVRQGHVLLVNSLSSPRSGTYHHPKELLPADLPFRRLVDLPNISSVSASTLPNITLMKPETYPASPLRRV